MTSVVGFMGSQRKVYKQKNEGMTMDSFWCTYENFYVVPVAVVNRNTLPKKHNKPMRELRRGLWRNSSLIPGLWYLLFT